MSNTQNASQLASQIVNQVQVVEQVTQEQPQFNQQAAWEINNIFAQLQTCFPAWRAAIKSQNELNMTKQTWAKALIENNVTSLEQVAIGMKKARASDSDFMPSVGKFITWCLGTDEKTSIEMQAIEVQQRRQADISVPLLRKQPTDEEIEIGNDALSNIMNKF